MIARLIDAFETARHTLERGPVATASWNAVQDAELALWDHVRRCGPVFHAGVVYAPSRTGLVVIRGVRTAEEMEREATSQEPSSQNPHG